MIALQEGAPKVRIVNIFLPILVPKEFKKITEQQPLV